MKNRNLSIVNSNDTSQKDVVITNDGSTTISFREMSRRVNISTQAIRKHILVAHPKANTSAGLSEFLQSQVAQHYAYKCQPRYRTVEAQNFLDITIQAGIRAYNYSALNIPLPTVKLLEENKVELKLIKNEKEKLEKKVDELEKELKPVLDRLASVSQHLKLLGVNDRSLVTKVLDMVTDKVNHHDIKVNKFDRVIKKGFEQDVNVKRGTYYDTVTISPEAIESCLICMKIKY